MRDGNTPLVRASDGERDAGAGLGRYASIRTGTSSFLSVDQKKGGRPQ